MDVQAHYIEDLEEAVTVLSVLNLLCVSLSLGILLEDYGLFRFIGERLKRFKR